MLRRRVPDKLCRWRACDARAAFANGQSLYKENIFYQVSKSNTTLFHHSAPTRDPINAKMGSEGDDASEFLRADMSMYTEPDLLCHEAYSEGEDAVPEAAIHAPSDEEGGQAALCIRVEMRDATFALTLDGVEVGSYPTLEHARICEDILSLRTRYVTANFPPIFYAVHRIQSTPLKCLVADLRPHVGRAPRRYLTREQRSHMCELCGSTYGSRSSLCYHRSRKHPRPQPEPTWATRRRRSMRGGQISER